MYDTKSPLTKNTRLKGCSAHTHTHTLSECLRWKQTPKRSEKMLFTLDDVWLECSVVWCRPTKRYSDWAAFARHCSDELSCACVCVCCVQIPCRMLAYTGHVYAYNVCLKAREPNTEAIWTFNQKVILIERKTLRKCWCLMANANRIY